ncbi:hypothetical protein [Yersinia phage fHe-Yen9-03]|uniref:Uncharacterized protein n=1 Tax=Yersinia phage fHe-Yen9-03 TaxID=2052743 RepID=A0A2C9CZ14_9CAUD|nr:hypothetical protein [Yersinia phage fHe-Yen9-03]
MMEVLNNILKLDYFSNLVYSTTDNKSIFQVKIIYPDFEKYLIINKITSKRDKYCTLITDNFSLIYDGISFMLIDSDGILLDKIEPSISEEWFFQQSVVKNFSAVEYEDIKLLKTVHSKLWGV